MSLPLPWVDRIFEKLTLVYGQQFLSRWRDLDIDAVKFDWANELDGFERHPAAIAFALQHLDPDKPPTVLVFRAIACRAPAAELPALPEPKANPDRMRAELAKLKGKCQPSKAPLMAGAKDWAHRIIARHAAGEPVNVGPLRMAHQALGLVA